ncbi:MAG: CRISPR-associated protein Csn1 [Bacteroidales bacterium]|nr:CRISPR-associated protein Csn1 [Bacteroidales bacterium]
MSKILGLDLGTNSIGWAVVEQEGSEFRLLDKGVRIFQEGVKIEKGIESSKAAERTDHRSSRRLKYRRKLRKIQTLKVLSEYDLCPELSDKELDEWRYKKNYPYNEAFRNWLLTDVSDNEEERRRQIRNPYFYRSLAVTEKLDLEKQTDRFRLGRAFYHIAQRRGFLSNRLETTQEAEGAVKKEISEISTAKGEKTLGQYFYDKYTKGDKIRDVYTHREEHYLEELDAICRHQNLPAKVREKLYRAIFYQRPLKSQKGLIGKCVFEPSKQRCSVSHPKFEEYRMLCFVNNIKIKTPQDSTMRFLSDSEREKIKPLFYRKSKETFDFEDIAKALSPNKKYKYYRERDINEEDHLFNYSIKTVVSGNPVSSRLKDIFGDDFMEMKIEYIREKDGRKSFIDINDIWHVLFTFDSFDRLKEFAEKRLSLNDDHIDAFLRIKPKHEYSSLSLKAINKILTYLRKGLIYPHSVFLANMDKVIPENVWSDPANQEIIIAEIEKIIQTQDEEKLLVDVVNGIIKNARDNHFRWSNEAKEFYRKELNNKIIDQLGEKKYSSFSEEKKKKLKDYAFGLLERHMNANSGLGEFVKFKTLEDRIKDFLKDNFQVDKNMLNKLYHPSAIEVYRPPERKEDGKFYLGSPMIASVRNPMAMRALHQLRKVINELIRQDMIDQDTKVNIEMSRGLLNANERAGYQAWQRERENQRKEYYKRIKEYYTTDGKDTEPTSDDILKYQLWEEQNHKCIYTGKEIALHNFLGANPSFDIEHTIPRSLSFDNSQENKTLCENKFNRSVKKNKIPYELANHQEILSRIKHWKDRIENLDKQIQRTVRQTHGIIDKQSKDRAIQKRHRLKYERDYYYNKYNRFERDSVPEGFKNSQIIDTGIITKYARLYLKTLFNRVYTVKGNTVADFRKMWGLQQEYTKKERVNHVHHCVDAITIACITKTSYEELAKFYHDWEEYWIAGSESKPRVELPWKSFVRDVNNIEKEILVSHYTPDVLPKQTKKKLRRRGRIQYNQAGEPVYQQGDTARASLHQETFYGAIEKETENKKGEKEKQIKYVVRKPLADLEDRNIKNIVDDRIRTIVTRARNEEKGLKKEIENLNKELNNSEEDEEQIIKNKIEELKGQIQDLYSLPNKSGNPVPIKKVRVFTPTVTNPINLKEQRDKSKRNSYPYKEHYHVVNAGNYLMAIYEGKDDKGKIRRDFRIINNLEAAEYYKLSVQKVLKPQGINDEGGIVGERIVRKNLNLNLKAVIKTGTLVLFYKNNKEEVFELSEEELRNRLYKVIKLNKDGRITFRFHQEARNDEMLKSDYEEEYNEKAPKSLTNGESKFNFQTPYPKLLLSPGGFNMLIENYDFSISVLGRLIFK